MSDEANGWHPREPVLLTREQAAEWCQVSLPVLDAWTYEPGFPVLRRAGGHFVRIHRGELERWLAERSRSTNPEPVHNPPLSPRRLRKQ